MPLFFPSVLVHVVIGLVGIGWLVTLLCVLMLPCWILVFLGCHQYSRTFNFSLNLGYPHLYQISQRANLVCLCMKPSPLHAIQRPVSYGSTLLRRCEYKPPFVSNELEL